MQRIALVDYGTGNLHSVIRALHYVAEKPVSVEITDDRQRLLTADRVVFPGQGAMHECYHHLVEKDLWSALQEVCEHRPFLGICLGLHCLLSYSEEGGGTQGLGLLSGSAQRFPNNLHDEYGNLCRIPHMGWNQIDLRKNHPLLQGIESGSCFYFAHSYYAQATEESQIIATTRHGLEFSSIMARDNLFATQFHPEKSGKNGLRLLHAFLNWDGSI